MRKIKTDTKRRTKAAVLTAAAAAAVSMLAVTLKTALTPADTREKDITPKTAAAANETTDAENARGEYVIREYNGQVCVFHSDYAEIPAIMTQISAASLGSYDRELVQDGVYVSSREDVLKYLENFMS